MALEPSGHAKMLISLFFSRLQVKPVRHTVCMAIATVAQQCFSVMGPFLNGLLEVSRACVHIFSRLRSTAQGFTDTSCCSRVFYFKDASCSGQPRAKKGRHLRFAAGEEHVCSTLL